MAGLRCEYAYLGAGRRSRAAYSEHRVETTEGRTVGCSGIQRSTCSSRPLECWLGEKNTCSASRSRTVACRAPARCRARLESRQVQGEPWAAHCPHPAALPALRAALPTLQTLSAVPAALSAALPAAHSRPALSALLNCPHRRASPGTPQASGWSPSLGRRPSFRRTP